MAYPEIVQRLEVISVDRKDETVAARSKSDPHLEIAHVLFIDVVGYSKLLVNEQRALIEKLNEIVRKAPQVRKSDATGKLIRLPAGDGMGVVFFQMPEA